MIGENFGYIKFGKVFCFLGLFGAFKEKCRATALGETNGKPFFPFLGEDGTFLF
jgi:hypothetical protein